jgi:hypothetical protein
MKNRDDLSDGMENIWPENLIASIIVQYGRGNSIYMPLKIIALFS